MSSALGSNAFANAFGAPTVSYGLSKAALNYLNTAFRYAEPNVTFLSIHPGWVATVTETGDYLLTKNPEEAVA